MNDAFDMLRLAELARTNPSLLIELGILRKPAAQTDEDENLFRLKHIKTGQVTLWIRPGGFRLEIQAWRQDPFDFAIKDRRWLVDLHLQPDGSWSGTSDEISVYVAKSDKPVGSTIISCSLDRLGLPQYSPTYPRGKPLPNSALGQSRFSTNPKLQRWATGPLGVTS